MLHKAAYSLGDYGSVVNRWGFSRENLGSIVQVEVSHWCRYELPTFILTPTSL